MKSLVLGGSVFVGRHLVDLLQRQGHDVAVLNRGKTHTDLSSEVERLVADRTDLEQMGSVLADRQWDGGPVDQRCAREQRRRRIGV